MNDVPEQTPARRILSALAATTEVLALLAIGAMLANVVLTAIEPANVTSDIKEYAANPQRYGPLNTYVLAATTAGEQLVEFTVLLGAAFLLGWRRYRRPIAAYRLTRNGQSVLKLVAIGLLLYCVSTFPTTSIHLANQYFHFGEGAKHWKYSEHLPHDFGYFLFGLAGNTVLPPLLEETFVRGYVLTRFLTAFGAASAILLTATFFTLAHAQYLIADPYALAMVFSGLFSALCLTYVAYKTGSLIPTMVAHVLINSPFNSPFAEDHRWLQLGLIAMVITIIVYRRIIWRSLADFLALFRRSDFSTESLLVGFAVIAGVLLTSALAQSTVERAVNILCLCVAIATALVLYRTRGRHTTAQT